jgi:hypothetical protein
MLVLAMTLVAGGCSGSPVSHGPVRTQGMVTEKRQLLPPGNVKAKPRYFLWVNTDNGLVYVEVTEEMFHRAKAGEFICIHCDSEGP